MDGSVIAENEAGLIIQKAQAEAASILADAGESLIIKQRILETLESEIKAKTAELNQVLGDLDAAKSNAANQKN